MDTWYQRFKMDCIEHGMLVPTKQQMFGRVLKLGVTAVTVLGYFVDKWVFSKGELSGSEALESAERNATVELSHKELRQLIKSYIEKHTDELVDVFLVYFEEIWREKHGH
jgi:hypothetical protein